ncbi:NrtA/SsuA/CpmA family ABC transporter substrate-binding protein [Treponema pedis]|uniref:ABC transporter substrate-binding protein n=1 Tax=Treponema pedis TaxID=409322 RepID=UPI003133DF62
MQKILSILLVCLALAAGCSKEKDGTAGRKGKEMQAQEEKLSLDKLTVTYVTSPLNVPSIIEKEKGIFKKYLPNVELTYAEITSGAEQTQALASGDVHILHAVGGSSVAAAAAAGADIKIINMYSRAPEAFALYSKDGSLTSPESLKGKTIAGPMGTNLHELLVSYLATGKMNIEDVNFVNMSIPDAFAAVEGGSIDVAMLGGPAAFKASQIGLHKITDGKGLIEAIICVASTQKFYDEHKDILERIAAAQEEIRTFMSENAEETKDIVKTVLKLDDAAYNTMYPQYNFSLFTTEQDIEGLQKTADFMFKNKMIKNPVQAGSLFIN